MHPSRCRFKRGERSQGSDVISYSNTALNQQFPLQSSRRIKARSSTPLERWLGDLERGGSHLLWDGIVEIKLLITKAYFKQRADTALMSAIRLHLFQCRSGSRGSVSSGLLALGNAAFPGQTSQYKHVCFISE